MGDKPRSRFKCLSVCKKKNNIMGETEKPHQIGVDSLDQPTRDLVDLGHEQQGENVGRIRRFLTSQDGLSFKEAEEKRKKEEAEFHMTMLEYMLTHDAQYRAKYEEVANKLKDAQQRVNEAMERVDRDLREARDQFRRTQDRAATLADGTRVYQSEDGNVYTEDGRKLSEEEAATVQFNGDEPSYEDMQRERERIEALERQREELERYQREVLDPATRRMEDEDSPPSLDELEEMGRKIDEQMPEAARAVRLPQKEIDTLKATKTEAEIVQQFGAVPISETFGRAKEAVTPLEPPVIPDPAETAPVINGTAATVQTGVKTGP